MYGIHGDTATISSTNNLQGYFKLFIYLQEKHNTVYKM